MNKGTRGHCLLRQQRQFQRLVAQCSRDELAQCLRLLGMYVSLYKARFGEMDDPAYAGLLAEVATDDQLEQLFDSGLGEAIAMLRTINVHAGPAMSEPLPALVN